MARHLDPTDLPEAKTNGYLLTVDRRSAPHGHCRLWSEGVAGSGYPNMRLTVPGRPSIQYGVHQIVFSLNSGMPLNMPNYEVSHLCHQKLCVSFEHLSYEPKFVNVKRNACFTKQECDGHVPYPACVLT
jgi:hypothetical protein